MNIVKPSKDAVKLKIEADAAKSILDPSLADVFNRDPLQALLTQILKTLIQIRDKK